MNHPYFTTQPDTRYSLYTTTILFLKLINCLTSITYRPTGIAYRWYIGWSLLLCWCLWNTHTSLPQPYPYPILYTTTFPTVVFVSMNRPYFTTPAIPIPDTPLHSLYYHYVVFKTHVSRYLYRVYIGWCDPTYSVVQQGHLTKRSTLGSVIK